ncbi:hypothetical protein LEMLEM_LOCUS18501 [Lemmus lemmus]
MALRTGPRSRRAAGDPPAAAPRPGRRDDRRTDRRRGRTGTRLSGADRGSFGAAVSVLPELALGHLRYRLTGVPPQSNSPPGTVPGAGRARPRARTGAWRQKREPLGARPPASPVLSRLLGAGRGEAPRGKPRPRGAGGEGEPEPPAGKATRRTPAAGGGPFPLSPGAAATPAAAGAIHGKGPARVQSRRRRRPPRAARGPPRPDPSREAPPVLLPPGEGEKERTGPRAGERGRTREGVRPPGAGGGGGASSSRGARPAPLRTPARPTQPLEPILIPKLRIRLADFPYLHCSNMPEAVHLGDLLRIWVRPGARFTPSPPDFQGPARAHRTPPEPRRFPRHGPLSRGEPIPGRPALHEEKRTLPGAPAGFSGIGRVTALDASRRPSPPLRIRGSEPDSLSIG